MSKTRTAALGITLGAALVAGSAGAASAAPRPVPPHAHTVTRHAPAPRTTTPRTTATRTVTARKATSSTSSSTAATSSSSTSTTTAVTYSSTTSISTAGLSANAVKVLKAVNAKFPQITSIGGVRSGSDAEDHATGHALDLMIPNYNTASGKALGNEVAAYLRAHQAELGVHYIIWSQHIWNVQRDAEGWRSMADRGSATANHYDHVHVSVY